MLLRGEDGRSGTNVGWYMLPSGVLLRELKQSDIDFVVPGAEQKIVVSSW